MRGGMLLLVIASSELWAQGAAPSPQPIELVRRAVVVMGGERMLRGMVATAVDFQSASFQLGQEETPLSPARGPILWGRIVTDWRGQRRVTTQEVRQITGTVIRQRQVIAGGIGMNEVGGTLNPMPPGAVAGALQAMRVQPDRLLLRALDTPASLTRIAPKTWRGEIMDGVRFAQGPDTLSLYFDRGNGLLRVAEAVTDDPILGDRRSATIYTRWQAAGGIKLPRQFDSYANERLQSQNLVTAVEIHFGQYPPAGTPDTLFAIPDSIARRAQPASATPPPVTVTLVELTPGVWRAEGGSHHSLVVDQGTRLVIVEAPQNATRMNAVLDTVKSRFPGKPIGMVVNTHHHWDHAGGMRAAMAAGHRVATHRRNVGFVRQIAIAPKTVRPDALSRGRAAPPIVPVGDSLVVGTGERRVVLYEMPTAHCEGMLAAFVPGAGILFASDVLSPPAAGASTPLAQAGSAEVVAFARARGIAVSRFAGGHGGVAAWAEVEQAAVRR